MAGKNPSDTLDKIKEKAEKKGDRQLPINTEIVTIIADEWDKMFSEIRELLDREITCKKCFVLDEWHEQAKELALKDKRIAELEAQLKISDDAFEMLSKQRSQCDTCALVKGLNNRRNVLEKDVKDLEDGNEEFRGQITELKADLEVEIADGKRDRAEIADLKSRIAVQKGILEDYQKENVEREKGKGDLKC